MPPLSGPESDRLGQVRCQASRAFAASLQPASCTYGQSRNIDVGLSGFPVGSVQGRKRRAGKLTRQLCETYGPAICQTEQYN